MNERSHESPKVRLDWWRFAIVATAFLSVIGFVAVVRRQTKSLSPLLEMAVLGLSAVAFFAYRWHRLRVDLAAGRLTPETFYQDPRAHVRGPILPLTLWFLATIGTIFAIVVLDATHVI